MPTAATSWRSPGGRWPRPSAGRRSRSRPTISSRAGRSVRGRGRRRPCRSTDGDRDGDHARWATPRSSGCSGRSAIRRRAARPSASTVRSICRATRSRRCRRPRPKGRLRPSSSDSACGCARATPGSERVSRPATVRWRLVRLRRRRADRRGRAAPRRRCLSAGRVQHRTAGGVGADGRADGARPRRARARAAALLVPHPFRPRRPARRGRRDLGLLRRASVAQSRQLALMPRPSLIAA